MLEDLLRRLKMDVGALSNALLLLFASPVPRGKLISGIILSGGTSVDVSHGLSQPAQGGFIAGASAGGAYTVDPVATRTTVTLRASAAVGADTTVYCWVF